MEWRGGGGSVSRYSETTPPLFTPLWWVYLIAAIGRACAVECAWATCAHTYDYTSHCKYFLLNHTSVNVSL